MEREAKIEMLTKAGLGQEEIDQILETVPDETGYDAILEKYKEDMKVMFDRFGQMEAKMDMLQKSVYTSNTHQDISGSKGAPDLSVQDVIANIIRPGSYKKGE